MVYGQVVCGRFVRRLNRFIALVEVDGAVETVHVKNTGRCAELLLPDVEVFLERSSNPLRKTAFSLISVRKGDRLINMDSQAPNEAVFEALSEGRIIEIGKLDFLKREVRYRHSRFDFYGEQGDVRLFMEVKGVTLEEDGIVRFPDAPTARGTRHVEELVEAVRDGYTAYLLFLVQMKGVRYFTPNRLMDPAFAEALDMAARSGVHLLAYDSIVTPIGMRLNAPVEICLQPL